MAEFHQDSWTAVFAGAARPVNTPLQDGNQDKNVQQGNDGHREWTMMDEIRNETEVAVPEKMPDAQSITKTERVQEVKEMETTTITKTQAKQGRYATIGRSGNNKEEKNAERKARSEATKRGRDLHGGMELLELDFLLDMVENIDGMDEYALTMRKLSFHELARTTRLSEIDSNALKYYCMDEDGIYDRRTQCEAMQELATRTEQSLGN